MGNPDAGEQAKHNLHGNRLISFHDFTYDVAICATSQRGVFRVDWPTIWQCLRVGRQALLFRQWWANGRGLTLTRGCKEILLVPSGLGWSGCHWLESPLDTAGSSPEGLSSSSPTFFSSSSWPTPFGKISWPTLRRMCCDVQISAIIRSWSLNS
jgi:hypothetical protein